LRVTKNFAGHQKCNQHERRDFDQGDTWRGHLHRERQKGDRWPIERQ
jgi:hypothetical protein